MTIAEKWPIAVNFRSKISGPRKTVIKTAS